MPPQLIEKASLTGFEALVRAAGRGDPHSFYYGEQDEATIGLFTEWAGDAANSLAFAITSTASILDLDAVILAGGLPEDRTADLLRMTESALEDYNGKGVHLPEIRQAEIGITARAIGAANMLVNTQDEATAASGARWARIESGSTLLKR